MASDTRSSARAFVRSLNILLKFARLYEFGHVRTAAQFETTWKELHAALLRPGRDLIVGAHGVGEGIPASRAEEMVPKFWDDGLLIVRAGGSAGMFSAICAGWTGGRARGQTKPITKEIRL